MISVWPTVAGTYTLTIALRGSPILNLPAVIQILPPPSAARSYAEGPGLEVPRTHSQQLFTIHAVDQEGRPLSCGGDNFTVSILGPQIVEPEIQETLDGTYTVYYVVTVAGTYTVEVRFDGVSIKDTPLAAPVNAAP